MESTPPQPAPFALRVRPYSAGMNRVAELRLSANEGPVPLNHQTLLNQLTGEDLSRYPAPGEIEARLADYAGVDVEGVLVTAGADDAIDRLCRAYLAEGRNIVLPHPTFEMFERGALLAGAEVRRVPWGEGAFPEDRMLATVDDTTGVIVIVSPDNPSGRSVAADTVRRVAEAAPGTLVVLDAAYEEFADEPLTRTLFGIPNLLILRTLSKAWSLAGARVGFGIGHPGVIEVLRTIAPPYTVSGLSMAVARAALDRPEGARAYVEHARRARSDLRDVLADVGVACSPSQTNFVFLRHPSAQPLRDGLLALGILVRSWPDDPDLGDALRITCPGGPEDLDRLKHALGTVLRPEALLLDMDGVMVDVSGSYREAIRETARHFGVEVSLAEIQRAKAGSDVNNDWRLTRRLLEAAGERVSLEDVTKVFEARYQGTSERPGLREVEAPLCDPDWLRALAERIPIAVVTGRPRKDAGQFLDRFGLGDAVSVMVCMEDAEPKPSPAPVRLALERLGVETAWMCGDTPDDIRAALGARVLPVGIGDNPNLGSAGAWRVLEGLRQLDDLLP